jgi:hypothetical protein
MDFRRDVISFNAVPFAVFTGSRLQRKSKFRRQKCGMMYVYTESSVYVQYGSPTLHTYNIFIIIIMCPVVHPQVLLGRLGYDTIGNPSSSHLSESLRVTLGNIAYLLG